MARYRVLRLLNHDLVEYKPGEEIELHPSEAATKQLLEAKVIEYIPPRQATDAPTGGTPVEKFHAPTTEAEITKAVEKSKVPNPEVTCLKCKKKVRLTDFQVVKTTKNKLAVKGRCPICQTMIFRITGGKSTE